MNEKKLIVVAGPTASGKTALGIALAKALNGEIVSADSMQIYRGMDIGTAKATQEEQAEVRHHMLDLLEPGENYSVSRYVEDATAICEELFRHGKQPVVVGGTGLYIDALLAGRQFAGTQPENQELRERLSEEYDRIGGERMLERLREVDPDRAGLCTRCCPLLTVLRSIGASKSGWTACAKGGCLRKRRCSWSGKSLTRVPVCRPSATGRLPRRSEVKFPGKKQSLSSSRRPAVTPNGSLPGFGVMRKRSGFSLTG